MFALTDFIWNSLITAVVGGVVAVAIAWINRRTNAKLNEIAKTTDTTHALVNAQKGTMLDLNASTSKQLAIAHPTAENITASKLADKLVVDHAVESEVAKREVAKK